MMNNEPKNQPSQAAQKPYRAPGLIQYGTISEITKTVDDMGNGDGAGMGKTPPNKT